MNPCQLLALLATTLHWYICPLQFMFPFNIAMTSRWSLLNIADDLQQHWVNTCCPATNANDDDGDVLDLDGQWECLPAQLQMEQAGQNVGKHRTAQSTWNKCAQCCPNYFNAARSHTRLTNEKGVNQKDWSFFPAQLFCFVFPFLSMLNISNLARTSC